jgi:hypothetical protein
VNGFLDTLGTNGASVTGGKLVGRLQNRLLLVLSGVFGFWQTSFELILLYRLLCIAFIHKTKCVEASLLSRLVTPRDQVRG